MASKIVIDSLDHFVLTVRDPDAAIAFYRDALGMEPFTFGNGRLALKFGNQKINLHTLHREHEPKADKATPGSADVCFLTKTPIPQVVARLNELGIPIVHGPGEKSGAQGPILSVYVRDPDLNLVEISNLLEA